jgi:ArsR family transcriptional regulator
MEMTMAVRAMGALAQETRLSIFRKLVQAGPTGLAAGEIASAVGASPANLSFHLKELAHAGLVRSRQEGRYVFYSAHYPHVNQLIAFLVEHCCEPAAGG